MKNIVLIALFASFNTFAQTFGDLGDEWHNYSLAYYSPTVPGTGVSTWHLATMNKYVGDTIVGEDTYQIFVKCLKSWSTTGGGLPYYNNERFYVFQDSLQVFYGTPGDMELFYDFNLAVGDSMLIYVDFISTHVYNYVTETDSIEIDGTWRKRIIFQDFYETEGMRWVEGVGDELYGLFRYPSGYWDEHYSFCMKHENVVQVGTCGIIHTCPVEFVDISPVEDAELLIYPNPVLNQMTISVPQGSASYSVNIFNYKGELVFQKADLFETVQIDLSDLSNGLYMVMVTDENSMRTSQIVKQ